MAVHRKLCHRNPHRGRSLGVSNVLGAILFVFAIIVLTSLIAVVTNELSAYVSSVDYMNAMERDRSFEQLSLTPVVSNSYIVSNITNVGSVPVNITQFVVLNKATNSSVIYQKNLFLNPGQILFNYNMSFITPSNATVLLVTSKGNSFLILVQGGAIWH
jgi:hypothetical protein